MKTTKQLTKKLKLEIRNWKFVFTALFLITILLVPDKIFAEILFSDNYNIDGSGDVNTDYNIPGRQSGTFSPLEYNSATPTISDTGPYADKYFCDQRNDSTPYKNFTKQGNFCMGFDSDLYTNLASHFQVLSCGKAEGTGFGTMVGLDVFWGKYGGVSLYAVSETNNSIQFFPAPGLFTDSNMAHNVKVGVSLAGFPPSPESKSHAVIFIDDIPYPFNTVGQPAFVRTLATNLYNDNYISIGNWVGYEPLYPNPPATADNFFIATLPSNELTTTAWTDDTSSGIDGSKFYSHAVSFGDSAGFSVDGVQFTGSGSAMSGSGWKFVTVDSVPLSGPTASSTLNVTGESSGIASNFISSASYVNAGALVISDLTPHMQYELSVFCVGSEAAGGRQSYFATSGGSPIYPIDQDEFGDGNGQRLSCFYTASKDGTFTISTTPLTEATPTWNWYGFCNKALPPIAPTTISATKGAYADKIHVNWEKVFPAESYFVYRAETNDLSSTNFVTEVISNFFDDTVPSVVVAKDYYYWVQSANAAGISTIYGTDYGFTKSVPPDTPSALFPNGNTITSPVQFTASGYNDGSGLPFAASHWQVSENSGFSSIKWTTGENGPPITSIFASRNSIPDGTNYWRVRYKNDKNTWSDWSESNLFICVLGVAQSGIFEDSFNVLGNGDVNLDCNADGRQFGNATPLNYIVSGTTEAGSESANPGELLLGQNSGISPIMSFESSDKFNIEFDVKLHNFDVSTDWLSIGLGKDDQSSLLPDSDSGLAAVFGADGTFKFYKGASLLHTQANAIPAAQEFHVLITTSTEDFDDGEPAYCSVFVNGTPMVNNDAFNKYGYTLGDGFVKNYVTMFNYNEVGTSASLIDNFKITTAATNVIKIHPWTNDDDSLIDATKVYTHLVNIDGEDVTIKEQDFIGTGVLTNQGFNNGDPNITTSTWALIDALNYMNFWPDTTSPNLTGNSFELGQFGAIGAGSPAIMLSGLTPNSSNTLYIYSWARNTGSDITFPNSYGGAVDLIDADQYGQLNGMIIQVDYIADKNGKFAVAATPKIDYRRFSISGFANLKTGEQSPQIDVDSMLDFGEDVSDPVALPLVIANIGGGVVDGTITGISEPFSLTTNVYFAVPGTNDTISVTFSPTEESAYTNVITLTGNGGTAEVTLTGTGIPEPCLFLIYYLSFIIYYLKRK